LLAFGEGMLIDRITHQKAIRPLPNILHEKLTYYLKLYLFIGGMPEVLQDYIDNKDILTVRNIQKDILKAYERDFSKHTSKLQAIKNAELWHSVPYQLSKENKKFKYSDVKKKTRAVDYQQTIEWLRQAGLINLAYNISTPKIPLAGYSDLAKFKIYLLDTGLLGAMLDVSSEMIVSPNKLFREYNGAFIENFVAMELICMGVENLFYWTSRGEAEVDFVIQYKNSIYPVEVKSGKSRTLKSLRSYQHNNNPEFIFRCSPRNYFQSNEFVNFPLYAVSTFLQLVQIVK